MDWAGTKNGEGYEYRLLGMCIALLISSGGAFSIDEKMSAKKASL